MNLQEIGTIVSTMDSPSTTKVSFVCTNKTVHKGSYVQINYAQGTLIGVVTDVIKRNRYFENPDSVKEFEISQEDISKVLPSEEWEFLEGVVKPLGVFFENKSLKLTVPPSPGLKVYLAEEKILARFLKFEENGVFLGHIDNPTTQVKFDLDKLFQKHLAILAQSGAGKSYLTSVILEELLDRKKEDGRLAVVLFDTHGEYYSFADPTSDNKYTDYSPKTIYINSKEIKIGCTGLPSSFFHAILPNLSYAQKRELFKIIDDLKKESREGSGPFDLRSIINKINLLKVPDKLKGLLINEIYSLESLYLFSKTDSPSVYDIITPGKLTIVDFSQETNQKRKQTILYYFSHKLFYGRVNNENIPPCLLIIEEAHQFAPETTTKENALSRNMLERIAREGRKFGCCICLISQRPVKLSSTILSQANTHIILRVTNPYDLKHIGQSSEGLDQKSIDMISSLRVGEALVVGEASSFPVFFSVRQKKSKESHLSTTLSSLSKNYEINKELQEKDIDSFM
jgi:uncharacterized protein